MCEVVRQMPWHSSLGPAADVSRNSINAADAKGCIGQWQEERQALRDELSGMQSEIAKLSAQNAVMAMQLGQLDTARLWDDCISKRTSGTCIGESTTKTTETSLVAGQPVLHGGTKKDRLSTRRHSVRTSRSGGVFWQRGVCRGSDTDVRAGKYVALRHVDVTSGISQTSVRVDTLVPGTIVDVLEVARHFEERQLRGRIARSRSSGRVAGWICLPDSNESSCWPVDLLNGILGTCKAEPAAATELAALRLRCAELEAECGEMALRCAVLEAERKELLGERFEPEETSSTQLESPKSEREQQLQFQRVQATCRCVQASEGDQQCCPAHATDSHGRFQGSLDCRATLQTDEVMLLQHLQQLGSKRQKQDSAKAAFAAHMDSMQELCDQLEAAGPVEAEHHACGKVLVPFAVCKMSEELEGLRGASKAMELEDAELQSVVSSLEQCCRRLETVVVIEPQTGMKQQQRRLQQQQQPFASEDLEAISFFADPFEGQLV